MKSRKERILKAKQSACTHHGWQINAGILYNGLDWIIDELDNSIFAIIKLASLLLVQISVGLSTPSYGKAKYGVPYKRKNAACGKNYPEKFIDGI